jgi:spore maturation protein CgeB
MKILLIKHLWNYEGQPIATYASSLSKAFTEAGHEVTEIDKQLILEDNEYKKYDLLFDIDCGKDMTGEHKFHLWKPKIQSLIKTAFFAIDSHGNADLHEKLARFSDHVFFAVWDKRDLFADHPSATWTPSFTDLEHFDGEKYVAEKTFDFGFFGSRHGQDRAAPMVDICKQNSWSYDVDEVGRKGKHTWPRTAQRMAACRVGFNHGQKHDGPNLRIMETMAMKLPLICDLDPRDGKGFLFEPWQHYIPYTAYTYEGLEDRMQWCMKNPDKAAKIAAQGYKEVCNNHLAEHRVNTILEVINK